MGDEEWLRALYRRERVEGVHEDGCPDYCTDPHWTTTGEFIPVDVAPDVRVTLVGLGDKRRRVEWPVGWPIPARGDEVMLEGAPVPMYVRHVVWFPEDAVPSVLLVVGASRVSS